MEITVAHIRPRAWKTMALCGERLLGIEVDPKLPVCRTCVDKLIEKTQLRSALLGWHKQGEPPEYERAISA